MTTAKKITAGSTILALAVLLLLIGINQQDEDLSPAARNMLQVPTPQVPEANNGYFMLLGMSAPNDADPMEVGRRIQATIFREYRESPARTNYSTPSSANEKWPDWEQLRCPLKGADCVAHFLKYKQALKELMAARQVQLQRYARLAGMREFEEPPILSAHMPFPAYSPFVYLAELHLAQAVFLLDAGDTSAGLGAIAREIEMHRRLLATSRTLLWKMINVNVLRRDYQVLSDVLERWPELAQTHRDTLAPIMRPLDSSEEDMRRVLDTEVLFAANSLVLLRMAPLDQEDASRQGFLGMGENGEAALMKCCFRLNASLNLAAQYWPLRAEAVLGGAAGIDKRKEAMVAKVAAWHAEVNRVPQRYLYNAAGRILLTVGQDALAFFPYAERVHDLDGYIRLVSLQALLRREAVSARQLAAKVAQAPAGMRNPYNGLAMRWDDADSSLSFTGNQPATANPDTDKTTHRIKMKFL